MATSDVSAAVVPVWNRLCLFTIGAGSQVVPVSLAWKILTSQQKANLICGEKLPRRGLPVKPVLPQDFEH